jgi:hypothetical protein
VFPLLALRADCYSPGMRSAWEPANDEASVIATLRAVLPGLRSFAVVVGGTGVLHLGLALSRSEC